MINKEMLEQDTKDRLNTVNDIIHNCISMKVESINGLQELYKNNKIKDEDFTKNRNESRILLNDVQNIIKNIAQIDLCHLSGYNHKDVLGFDLYDLRDLIDTSIKMMMCDRRDFSVINTPDIYKLLNNAIDNYIEASNTIDNYFKNRRNRKQSYAFNPTTLNVDDITITTSKGKIFINGEEFDYSEYVELKNNKELK